MDDLQCSSRSVGSFIDSCSALSSSISRESEKSTGQQLGVQDGIEFPVTESKFIMLAAIILLYLDVTDFFPRVGRLVCLSGEMQLFLRGAITLKK